MSKSSLTLQRACQVLRAKVRFANASIQLPGTPIGQDDTAVIREATRLYVETWIVPLLDLIERGETAKLARCIERDVRHPMSKKT